MAQLELWRGTPSACFASKTHCTAPRSSIQPARHPAARVCTCPGTSTRSRSSPSQWGNSTAVPAVPAGKQSQQQLPTQDDLAEEEVDDIFYDEEGDEDEDAEGQGQDTYAAELGLEVDDTGPGIETAGNSWAEAALRAANKVLSVPAMSNLQLYVFKALPGQKLDIRLDRLDDRYGSPSIDDIERFSRMLWLELDAAMGQEAAGQIALEVSSPGAERALSLPEDLQRFGELPLWVEYVDAEGGTVAKVLELVEYAPDKDATSWRLANVRANAPAKGRSLSKRARAAVMTIPVNNLRKARVHVDF